MNKFSKYLDDVHFIDWIYHPTEENNIFWESYIENHPDEKEEIDILKNILGSLKTKDSNLTDKTKKEILDNILSDINLSKKQSRVFKIPSRFFRYVAMLVFIFGVGFYFVNEFERKKDFSFDDMQNTSIDSITETQLILNSGKQLLINNKKSTVRFTNSGEVIVNHRDTLDSTPTKAVESLNQLIVPFGKRSKILLADGSVVHINAGSRFVFPKKFDGKQRKVFLDGEAFFEVASNKNQPFIVKTLEKDFEIEVVGTKFNVSSYASDHDILTVLTEGEVHINKVVNSFYNKKTKLKPGELATWNKYNKGVAVKSVNTDNYTLWTQGILQFESLSTNDVAKKIERFYNIQINIEETSTDEIYISGKLDLNDNVEKTLANFALTASLKLNKINTKKYMLE